MCQCHTGRNSEEVVARALVDGRCVMLNRQAAMATAVCILMGAGWVQLVWRLVRPEAWLCRMVHLSICMEPPR